MQLDEIIIKAIPAETCPVKNAAAMQRRILLRKRLIDYIANELENQFNAKPFVDTIGSGIQGVTNGRQEMQ